MPVLREIPLLRKVYVSMPSTFTVERLEDILLCLDYITTETPDLGVVPVMFGERVSRIDDRWIYCASYEYPLNEPPWAYVCGEPQRRPTEAHAEAYRALQSELQVAWNTVKEQSHSTDASIEARVDARKCTARAILAVAEATRCRVPRATRDALSRAADALHAALTSTRTRVSELKAKEAGLTDQDGDDVAHERERVRQGFSEVRSAFRQALVGYARKAAQKRPVTNGPVKFAARQGLRSALKRTRSGARF